MRTAFDQPAPLLPADAVFAAAFTATFRADARVRPAKRARRLAAGQRHAAAADNAVTPRLRAIGPRMHWLECSQGSVPRQTAPLPGVQTPGPSMVRKQTHCSAPGLQPTTPILCSHPRTRRSGRTLSGNSHRHTARSRSGNNSHSCSHGYRIPCHTSHNSLSRSADRRTLRRSMSSRRRIPARTSRSWSGRCIRSRIASDQRQRAPRVHM